MFRCLRVPASALLLSALLVPTVHAGAAPQLNSSEASVTSSWSLRPSSSASVSASRLSRSSWGRRRFSWMRSAK